MKVSRYDKIFDPSLAKSAINKFPDGKKPMPDNKNKKTCLTPDTYL